MDSYRAGNNQLSVEISCDSILNYSSSRSIGFPEMYKQWFMCRQDRHSSNSTLL